MAYATDAEVEDALGRPLTTTESKNVDNLCEQATDLVVGYLGNDLSPVPGAVTRVVATMVAAVYSKPSITVADYGASGYSASREAAGVHVGTESATTEGPWLTQSLKWRLNPYRRGAVNCMGMQSEQFPALWSPDSVESDAVTPGSGCV